MDEDYTVKVLSVSEIPLIDSSLRTIRAKHVTIMVGKHGPFSKDFSPPKDTLDDINAWKLQQQQYVQAVTS